MKFKRIKQEDYWYYSKLLKDFEQQFTYPLGDKTFTIEHGLESNSYFSFFETLGELSCFVLEDNDKVLGVGCAILRNIKIDGDKTQKFWYLCDFKLDKSVRGSGKLTKLMLRYFVPYYLKCNQMVAINMSPPEKNWLDKKLRSTFRLFPLKTTPVYFYEWDKQTYLDLLKLNPAFMSQFAPYSNFGHKDIVIEGKVSPIVHLVDSQHAMFNLDRCNFVNDVDKEPFDDAMYMLATADPRIHYKLCDMGVFEAYQGTMITRKNFDSESLNFSSAEI